jgi:hypothetical protein
MWPSPGNLPTDGAELHVQTSKAAVICNKSCLSDRIYYFYGHHYSKSYAHSNSI